MKRPRPQRNISGPIDFEPLAPSLASPIAVSEKKPDETIPLSLRVLLQNLPAFQRQGDPTLAPEDAKMNLPLSLIAEQLATGRVLVAPKVFLEAIPPVYRYLFHADEHETPVVLPLQEILQKVPASALQVRTDQEQLDTGEAIETPFSIQAEEDARRFRGNEKPAASPVLEHSPKIDKEPAQKIDAKEVVARATALPGVNGCAITFADGLSLAGNLPPAIAADGLCAVAPTLLQRIDQHMLDTKLGPLSSMTLHGATSAVTFFLCGNICLSALHIIESLTVETRRQLAELVKELSRTYSQPEISHVDN
jgi:predicted regulator of Ras-like GTPase activity (Roadblock/LC7/MglB family)